MKWYAEQLYAVLQNTTQETLEQNADIILEQAKDIAPKDTGNMVNTAHVVRKNGNCTIKFEAPYSIYVHERLDLNHPIGQAKFLETALRNSQYVEAIKLAIKGVLK